MIPLSVSSRSATEGRLGSARRWSWREALTAVALVLLLLNLVFYVLILARLFGAGP